MPESFNSPAASPTRQFSGQVAAFTGNDGEIGDMKVHFNTPAASPVVGFNINTYSPVRGFA